MDNPQQNRIGFVGGALAGVAVVALAAVGWMLGGGEGDTNAPSSASSARSSASATPAGATSQESPHTGGELAPIDDPEVDRLRGELSAAPDRLDLRKQLAIRLLRQAQFYAAFDEAQRILEAAPDDVDGLFVSGAIRVRMGQPGRALPLLERVLEQVPNHVPALTAKGQALLKAGHAERAVAVWTRALELSGGSNPQVEELLRSVPAGESTPHPPIASQ